MKRGEVWTIAGGGAYTSKPRPAVIVQSDSFRDLDSVTICPFTLNEKIAPIFRPSVEPSATNGLNAESRLMADKVTTIPKAKLGRRIGRLNTADVLRLERAMLVFLGLSR